MAAPASTRCPPLRDDHDAELLFIAEAGRLLAETRRTGGVEAVRSVTAMLDRQQRLAARRALEGPPEV